MCDCPYCAGEIELLPEEEENGGTLSCPHCEETCEINTEENGPFYHVYLTQEDGN